MDNQTQDMGTFLASLTKEEANACKSDETELGIIFSVGWSEATAVMFHRALLHARQIKPDVTVEGIFEAAFQFGLSFIGNEEVLARLTQAREDIEIVYRVQHRDGKGAGRVACIVSPDVSELAKRGRKRKVRGV